MTKECANCNWWDNTGYKDNKSTQHVGFCDRFKEVTAGTEHHLGIIDRFMGVKKSECSGFDASSEKEEFYRRIKRAQELKLELKNQTEIEF